jgi:hypothetical protein
MTVSLTSAFYLLCAAVAIGGVLALPYLRIPLRRLPWPIRVAHGAFGGAGLGMLLLALYHGLPPSTMGTTGFGQAAQCSSLLPSSWG